MKKVFLSLLVIAATMNVMAVTPISKAIITLKSVNGGQYAEVRVAEIAEYAEGVDVTNSVEYSGEGALVHAYVMYGDPAVKYEKFYAKSISNLQFGFKAKEGETEYLLSFKQVSGTIVLHDNSLGTSTTITADTDIPFVADAGAVNDERFVLYYATPAEPSICHQYGVLTITSHVGETLKVTDMDGVEVIAEQVIDETEKVIALDALTAGEQYKVILNGNVMIIKK